MMPNRRSFVFSAISGLIAARFSSVVGATDRTSETATIEKAVTKDRFPHFQSTPVSASHVKLVDQFWAPRQKTTREISVAWVTEAHDRAGGLRAFRAQPESYRADTSVVNMEAVKFIEAMAAVVTLGR